MATRATKKRKTTNTTTTTSSSDMITDKPHDDDNRKRGWCFTIFPDATIVYDDKATCPITWPKCRWGIVSIEKAPTTGRFHFQGAIYYDNVKRLATLQKHFGPSGHYEIMKGSPKQNETYCSKDGTHIAGPWTTGTLPSQGKRNDWDGAFSDAKKGFTRNQLIAARPHLAPCHSGLDALVEAAQPPPPISRTVTVFYLWGPTGTGKTHRALTTFPDAYLIRGPLVPGKSFDQYSNELTLVLDEWDPMEWPLTLLNGLLDKWKCPLMCRYANKYARWTKVIITTNHKPDQCYTLALRPTFLRRLDYIEEIVDRDTVVDLNREKVE